MTGMHDVIVIGSGPAGVSAAWPLVQAGRSVLMLDQGAERQRPADNDRRYLDIRQTDPAQWRRFLGENFHGLRNVGDVSPKLKIPDSAYVFDGFAEAYALTTDNFTAVGSLAKGGLSNAWGAGAYAYDDRDLADFPIARDALAESYKTVAGRIGVSGVSDDDMGAFYGDDVPLQDPVPLHENAANCSADTGIAGRR